MRLTVCVFVWLASAVNCANILGLFPTTAKSAFLPSEAIMKGLASRGHHVTVVSCFPQNIPIQNYTDISIRSYREVYDSNLEFKKHSFPYDLLEIYPFFEIQIETMGKILKSEELQKLIAANIAFDVVFHEMFVDNVFLMLARKFQAPIIAVGASYILPWAADRFAIPQNPSYIPVLGNGYSTKMSFYERLSNTVTNIRCTLDYWRVLVPKSTETYSKHFQEPMPSVEEAGRNVSMYFVNSHFSIIGARPYPPQVVEIGGIHLQPVCKLPKELQRWMDDTAFGVVCISFGSMLRGASLPDHHLKAFLAVIRRIPYKVLWKWEDEPLEDMPKNLKTLKWLPQRDVLAHPKVRLFISHGGLLGTMEAVASGVPIIGIPTNMDQANNVAALVDRGAALRLDYNNVTEENLFYATNQLLTDVDYARNAKLLSHWFLDRPQTPLDTAVYWTEYVIRYRGAPHLQSAAVHLTWYQYYLLDVIAFCLVVLVLTLSIMYYFIFRFCLKQILCNKPSKLKTK